MVEKSKFKEASMGKTVYFTEGRCPEVILVAEGLAMSDGTVSMAPHGARYDAKISNRAFSLDDDWHLYELRIRMTVAFVPRQGEDDRTVTFDVEMDRETASEDNRDSERINVRRHFTIDDLAQVDELAAAYGASSLRQFFVNASDVLARKKIAVIAEESVDGTGMLRELEHHIAYTGVQVEAFTKEDKKSLRRA